MADDYWEKIEKIIHKILNNTWLMSDKEDKK